MKCKKAPGLDYIDNDTLKDSGELIACILAKIYTYCIKQQCVPKEWKTSEMILIHKKGGHKDLKNLPTYQSPFSNIQSFHKGTHNEIIKHS